MLNWLTRHDYSKYDLIWLALLALAWNDKEYFIATVVLIVGVFTSDLLEACAKDRANSVRSSTNYPER